MPRRKRYTQFYSCHHVMLRGNGGQPIFFDVTDRIRFCLFLQKTIEEHYLIVHAFCFMNNHIHLILEPTTTALSISVHAFAGRYAQYFNRRHKQRGHLFQDRYRSILIEDDDYLIRLVRYIHLNPVRANLAAVPQNYFWSSYCSYLALYEITWLTQTRILKKFNTSDLEARRAIVVHTSKKIDAELDVSIVRESNQMGILGSKEFTNEVGGFNQQTTNIKIQFEDLIAAAQSMFQFKISEITSVSREKQLVDIRSILALAVSKVPTIYLQELASYLNRDSSTLCRLVKRARQSSDLSEQAEKLLETSLSFIKENTNSSAVMQNRSR